MGIISPIRVLYIFKVVRRIDFIGIFEVQVLLTIYVRLPGLKRDIFFED